MTRGRVFVLLALATGALGVLTIATVALAKRPKRTPCAPGRFLVDSQDAPLLQGSTAPRTDAVVIRDPRRISIASGCAEVTGSSSPGASSQR